MRLPQRHPDTAGFPLGTDPYPVRQTLAHQLVIRLVLAAVGWALAEQAKTLSQVSGSFLKQALGPATGLPPWSTPAQRRRVREALRQAQAVVDDPGLEVEEDEPGLLCGSRFLAKDGTWQDCVLANPYRFHQHESDLQAEDLDAYDRRATLWAEDGLPHHGFVAGYGDDLNVPPDTGELHEHQHAEVVDEPTEAQSDDF